jgi:hypothetical protein
MKRLILVTIALVSSLALLGQEKYFKQAVKKGKSDGTIFYVAHPSSLAVEKYVKWAKSQDDYIITAYKTDRQMVFGNFTNCVSEVTFIPMTEKETYYKYLADLAEKKRQNDLRDLAWTAAGMAFLGYMAERVTSKESKDALLAALAGSNSGSGSSNDNGSSNNNSHISNVPSNSESAPDFNKLKLANIKTIGAWKETSKDIDGTINYECTIELDNEKTGMLYKHVGAKVTIYRPRAGGDLYQFYNEDDARDALKFYHTYGYKHLSEYSKYLKEKRK